MMSSEDPGRTDLPRESKTENFFRRSLEEFERSIFLRLILIVISVIVLIPILISWTAPVLFPTSCAWISHKPLMTVGVFLIILSLAALACFFFVAVCSLVPRHFLLLILYLLIMIIPLLYLDVVSFNFFYKSGDVLPGKEYKEYQLGDYPAWLQKRVNSTKSWNKITTCLRHNSVCQSLIDHGSIYTAEDFYLEELSSVQSGCCKPSNDCNFGYVSPTNWTATANSSFANSDCSLWSNDPNVLCFDCQSCKAGWLDNLSSSFGSMATMTLWDVVGWK